MTPLRLLLREKSKTKAYRFVCMHQIHIVVVRGNGSHCLSCHRVTLHQTKRKKERKKKMKEKKKPKKKKKKKKKEKKKEKKKKKNEERRRR